MRAFTFFIATSPRCLVKARFPNPGSSLLNPRSHRYKIRQMMATNAAQSEYFENQAEFANIGGTADTFDGDSNNSNSKRNETFRRKRRAAMIGKTKKEQKQDFIQNTGAELAEQVKSMTDGEWEAVPLEQKHHFVKYMAKLLQEHPTSATEQQRRRYFETTLADPRSFKYTETVHEPYERMKMGLPFQLNDTSRSSGVTQAIYDEAEASLFDPDNVHALRNAMTEVKQIFVDYVQKKREGKGTEAERRKLANMMAELNVETQRHVANMFKYAEAKLREVTLEEKRKQLSELARLRALVEKRYKRESMEECNEQKRTASNELNNKRVLTEKGQYTEQETERQETTSAVTTNNVNEDNNTSCNESANAEKEVTKTEQEETSRVLLTKRDRKTRLKRAISKAMGVDYVVVDSLLHELEAQEKFMQFCEVFARLTLGKGFTHTAQDETLDAYTESLRKLYSVDAGKLSTLDVIQYLAAKDSVPPVEWARRWYERALLIPLQHTVEYQRLKEIQESEKRALELKRELANANVSQITKQPEEQNEEQMQNTKEDNTLDKADSPSTTNNTTTTNNNNNDITTAAKSVAVAAATYKENKVINLVEKMFLHPSDPRLKSVHEKRLRYIAYLQMERQITQARANAKRFEGVEHTEEGEQCRELYSQLIKRKNELVCHSNDNDNNINTCADDEHNGSVNIFNDPIAVKLFEEIRDIVIKVIDSYVKVSKSEQRAQKWANVLDKLTKEPSNVESLRNELQEKQESFSRTLLNALEDDVKSELHWLEAMEEAERPALLPIPEGMSYISAADVHAWRELREEDAAQAASPFARKERHFKSSLLGQSWQIPDKPLLFWGTGARAVQQALEHAAEDAERRRRDVPLAPPYPCAENPWGWRLVKDILDD